MGCTKSKDGSQPRGKGGAGNSPQKPGSSRQGSPKKGPKRDIKAVDQKQLAGLGINSIPKLIQTGKLELVHALINEYNLGAQVMGIRIEPDEIVLANEEKHEASNFNPLLYAIAHKRSEIVRYLLEDVKISLRQFGKRPGNHDISNPQAFANVHAFPLLLAISNKDDETLKELLSYPQAWDLPLLNKALTFIGQENFKQGISVLFSSGAAFSVYRSLSITQQEQAIRTWLEIAREKSPEFCKDVLDALCQGCYSLMINFIIIQDAQDGAISSQEAVEIITKSHLEISADDYGHFKYEKDFQSQLEQRAFGFRDTGEQEKAAIEKLMDHLKKHADSHENHKYFQNESTYDQLSQDIFAAITKGKTDMIKDIIESVDLRRLPFHPGQGHLCRTPELRQLEGTYWSPLLHLIYHGQVGEAEIKAVIQQLIQQEVNLRQALKVQNNPYGDDDLARSPAIMGSALLLAVEKEQFSVLQYLMGEDFFDVWIESHLELAVNTLKAFERLDALDSVFSPEGGNWNLAQNVFLSQFEERRIQFIEEQVQKFNESPRSLNTIYSALARKPYSNYLLTFLIETHNFRKMTSYEPYTACIEAISKEEIEFLSKIPGNEQRFMNFMRYISMLKEDDPQKVNGQKLIDLIFQVERFKDYQGQGVSLQVLENESNVQEEEGVEGAEIKIHQHGIDIHRRTQIREMNLAVFHTYFEQDQEDQVIAFLKTYKPTDITFFRGQRGKEVEIYQYVEDQFQRTLVDESSLNLLQLAVQKGFSKLVRYILHEHKILTPMKEQKTIDHRIILLNQINQEDETLTLRMALSFFAENKDDEIFHQLWSVRDVYSSRHLYPLVRFLVSVNYQDYIPKLLSTEMARYLFKIGQPSLKRQIVAVGDDLQGEENDLSQILLMQPYAELEGVPEDRQNFIYQTIKDKNVGTLEKIKDEDLAVSAHCTFENIEEEEEILTIIDNFKSHISSRDINAFHAAFHFNSMDCLKHLIARFGFAAAHIKGYYNVRLGGSNYEFNTLFLPIVLRQNNDELLKFLFTQNIQLSQLDLHSLIRYSMEEDPQAFKCKLILNAPYIQFYFTALLSPQTQKEILMEIIDKISSCDDMKKKQSFANHIVNQSLVKRPYVKVFTLLLLNGQIDASLAPGKIAQECLKNLTAEDFTTLAQSEDQMEAFEAQYQNIQGDQLENELAKIMKRYAKEGKNEQAINEMRNKKKVRIVEGMNNEADNRL